MKNVGIVMRKELYRVFSDKKMVFGLFIMPALLVVGLCLLVGIMITSLMEEREAHEPTVLVYQAPESFQEYMNQVREDNDVYSAESGNTIHEWQGLPVWLFTMEDTRYHIIWLEDEREMEAAKKDIYMGELDLILVFPKDFDQQVQNYQIGDGIPDIETYYNPSEDYSDNARADVLAFILEGYRNRLLEERLGSLEQLEIFTIDKNNEESVIQNDNKAQGKLFGSSIPYMITILLFAGAMSLGADTFAGEKERGTMAALLMSPIKRSSIVYGKLFALMILSGLSALIYGGAMIFAMPLLYKTLGAVTGQELSFPPGQMCMMLILIVTLVFLYVALIAVCSTLAKNMKEGSTFITPVYMIVMVIGVMTMFRGEEVTNLQYLIPLYGPTMALKNVFTLDITLPGFLFAVISNLGVGALFAWITSKMFQSEKIMFNA